MLNVLLRKMCANGRLLFSLFIINQYFVPNVLPWKICVRSKWEVAFGLFIDNQYCMPKMFLLQTSVKECFLTVCSCHVTCTFQSESTLYSCLNVKELLAQNRLNIWSLSDCNGTQTHNHVVHKRTLNYLAKLAKWLSSVVSTYLYGGFTLKRVRDIRTYR